MRVNGKLIARTSIAVVLITGVYFGAKLLKEQPHDRQIGQRIRLLDIPRPPPPQKAEEKPPEIKAEEEMEMPSEAQDQTALAEPEQLALDSDGTAGRDAFNLAARRGGRDIATLGLGKPGGQSGSGVTWGWYSGVIQSYLESIARADKRLQGQTFVIVVRLWIASDGRVSKFALVESTGDAKVDQALRDLLANAPPIRQPPPQEMPQPVRLRVTARLVN
ncbi:MAG: TonB family protein [Desulfobacterales bacterium]|nr:TonB family protein [Desulfobacterales bacterium]